MGVVLFLSHLPNPPPTSMGHLLMIIHLCQKSLCSLGNYMRCSSMPKRETLLTLLAGCPEPHASRSMTTKLLSKPLCHDFFKQTKYKSSQRQLNLYGFSRGGSGATKGSYHHPSLVKGRKELLALINRVKIKGTGRPRALKFTGTNAITDTDSSDNLNESNPTSTPTPEVTSLEQSSGIDVILEAIQ